MLFKSFWDNRPQLDAYLRHVIARNQHETGELLDKITTPTLVLVGGEDKADADTGNHVITSEHLRDNIHNTEFAVVEGCGHGFFWHKPEETNKIIGNWLDRH
jgi:pimeloyl-ACP methyl ester carboxylesterase